MPLEIKRKQAELERHEKRLKSLASVRPAFMDEYERLEKDLVKHYEGYLERFRNLDFLESELDLYHKVKGRFAFHEIQCISCSMQCPHIGVPPQSSRSKKSWRRMIAR